MAAWWEYPDDELRSDFRPFLAKVWEFLQLPEPTEEQRCAAYFMQHGYPGYYRNVESGRIVKAYDPEGHDVWVNPTSWKPMAEVNAIGRNDIVMAFRGIGKSWSASAFALWNLYRDPFTTKVLVISASGPKAKEFVAQSHSILIGMELLRDLRPRTDQRDTVSAFDVNGASISQSYSLKAVGATGQITGSRATLIISDDIEIKDNSKTVEARAGLLLTVSEFESIRVPDVVTQILVLGTPQSEESIYRTMIRERGYGCWCWPSRFPMGDKRENYLYELADKRKYDVLAPEVRVVDHRPELAGFPTAPRRFSDEVLRQKESAGRSYYALQFQLDTTLSDAERYPLKAFDLMVANVNTVKAPVLVQWGVDSNKRNMIADIPNHGFTGDYLVRPLFADSEWREYTASVLFVDPSGRGADETGWAVVKDLNGYLWVPEVGGLSGDTAAAMLRIAMAARQHKVNMILVEPNYAGQIWIAAFMPVLAKVWPGGCTVLEAEWAKGQKEERIIDTLEPVMNQHRLIVDDSVAKDEILMYQLTHITRERGCLTHDDRLDALAGAVAHFTRTLMQDTTQAAKAMKDAETDKMLEEFIELCQTNKHGFRSNARMKGKRRGRVGTTIEEFEVYGPYS